MFLFLFSRCFQTCLKITHLFSCKWGFMLIYYDNEATIVALEELAGFNHSVVLFLGKGTVKR